MAVTYQASDYLNFNGTSGSKAFDVGTGDNRLLLVSTETQGGTDGGVQPTYGGTNLTQITSITVGGDNVVRFWYLKNPTSGSNTLACSRTNTGDTWLVYACYNGTDQTTQGDTFITGTSTTPLNLTLTTPVDNCWTACCVYGTSAGLLAGTATTFRVNNTAPYALFDSNAAITPAGSNTLQVTETTGTMYGISVAIRPVASGGGAATSSKKFTGAMLMGVGA